MEVLLQTNLLDHIGDIWRDNFHVTEDEKVVVKAGCDFFGHFALLANMLMDSADEKQAMKGACGALNGEKSRVFFFSFSFFANLFLSLLSFFVLFSYSVCLFVPYCLVDIWNGNLLISFRTFRSE
jgi:hypothetical protein